MPFPPEPLHRVQGHIGRMAFAVKAEAVLGLQLVVRHRAPRLAVLLAVLVAGPIAWGLGNQPTERRSQALILGVAIVAVVASSRLLAQGAALEAVRLASSPWLLAPFGRFVGAFAIVVPVAATLSLVLAPSVIVEPAHMWTLLAATLGAAAAAAVTLALTPIVGASASGALGLFGVWVGSISPRDLPPASFDGPADRILEWAWYIPPMPWRASRWLESGGWLDPLWLVAWITAGLIVAAWTSQRRAGTGRPVG